MDRTTPLARLVSLQLDEPVATFIRRRRAERKVSIRDVVDDIHQRTGIRLSPQTVANWSATEDPAPQMADTG